ncbi:ABC transporter permease subunit [Desulfovibrio sp. OttesenSCG-928-F20]|nr:ABC transporter permease subunit [Desulfovibrio sp. OttesenSCG-928-F20]
MVFPDSGRQESRLALLTRLAAVLALLGVALLFAMIALSAIPAFLHQGEGGVFGWSWRPYQGEFGILAMLCGSVILGASALLLAWPLSLAICCFTISRPESPFAALSRGCIRLMTAIPTVAYGFAAIFLVTPLVRAGLGGSGFCWLTAALVLTLLILPTMVLVLEAGLSARLEKLCPGGLALGFDRLDLLWFFVLPQSRKVLLAAALLGIGRAVGDTLLPLMLAGNAPQVPQGLGDSMRTLTAHMALVTANEVGGAAYNSLFAAGALLLLITAITSLTLRRLQISSKNIET